jgi:hypothetical protein
VQTVACGAATDSNVAAASEEPPCILALAGDGELQHDSGEGIDLRPPLLRLSDGRLVARSSIPERINVWRADGTFLTSSGKRGLGPGEFTWIDALFLSNSDTLYIKDSNGRVHV